MELIWETLKAAQINDNIYMFLDKLNAENVTSPQIVLQDTKHSEKNPNRSFLETW